MGCVESFDRPSMVTILSVGFTALTGYEHERTTSPLMCTEQAPHCATPQPYLVPVSPTCSRITHRRGVSPSTFTSRTLPLMFSFAMGLAPPCGMHLSVHLEKRHPGRLQGFQMPVATRCSAATRSARRRSSARNAKAP